LNPSLSALLSKTRSFRRVGLSFAVAAFALSSLPGFAANLTPQTSAAKTFGVGGLWQAAGAAPALFGQVENIPGDGPIVGAIHTVVAHPTNPNILWAGAVNGGIWVTHNATAAKPNWLRTTDDQASISIGALDLDPTDPARNTLVAGIGLWSSFGFAGGRRTGLLRSTTGGILWTPIDGGGTLAGKDFSGVAVRGKILIGAVDFADDFNFTKVGIFRSTDGGATFTQISLGDGTVTGLPGGVSYDLVGDPTRPKRLFTNIDFADLFGGTNGIYRSDDTGAAWTKVSSPAMDALLVSGAVTNVELAVGRSNNVYCALVDAAGQLGAVFRSGNGGASWTQMDLPTTNDGGPVGIHPSGQGFLHLSIAADPVDANIVYVGGDRQPYKDEALGGPVDFPNSIGANDFSGRLFRGDASKPAGSQWVHLTHSNALGAPGGGTASNSSPHADSREMTFDAAGNLIETDDGGIYKRTRPRSNGGDWFSVIGNLQTGEYHDVAWDGNSKTLISGSQDNGVQYQQASNHAEDWAELLGGDGGDVAVDDTTTPGVSIRYSANQFLGNFNRTYWDAANNFLGFDFPALNVLGGDPPPAGTFVSPVELNQADQNRLVIGDPNGLYESLDRGDNVRLIAPDLVVNNTTQAPLAYGTAANPDALWLGSGPRIFVRTAAFPAPLVQSLTYPGKPTGRLVADIALDPASGSSAYVTDSSHVYRTTDAGVTWSEITGNLQAFLPGRLRTITFVTTSLGDAIVVGGQTGAFLASRSTGFSTWFPLGLGLPTVPVFDLDYDRTSDRLIAGTLGRGAWTLDQVKVAVLLAH